MSFLDGPECSTSANPLGQFQKHVQDDQTLQRDRLVSRGPAGALNGFRSTPSAGPQDASMNSFLNGPQRLQQQDIPLQNGHVRVDPSQGVHLRASSASPTWANDFQAAPSPMESAYKAGPASPFSADEFARFRQLSNQAASSRSSPMSTTAGQSERPMLGVGMVNPGLGFGMISQPMYQSMYQQQQQQQQHQQRMQEPEGKGKGKVVELDEHKWEEEFASLELEARKEKDAAGAEDEAQDAEAQMDDLDRELMSETNYGDFDSIWRGIQAQDGDRWNDWDGIFNQPRPSESYLFEKENLFMNESNAFEEGVKIMRAAGNLSLAALAFEAAVQQNPEHVEAWVYLGSAQAQNEKETAAIRALEQALNLDPDNLAALMGLAVSYTNEAEEVRACRSLERWLAAKYPQVLKPEDVTPIGNYGFTDRDRLFERVSNLYIQAAQLSPDGESMDPDVQVGLGVLFYGQEAFDKAVDCFKAALHSSQLGTTNQQEQVHLLWNRLGATLANSNRPEEAVESYERALALRPNFVRARYNLGVSCLNIHCYQEAASHFLAALELHKTIEKSGRSQAYEILSGGTSAPPGSANAATSTSNPMIEEQLARMSAQNQSTTVYETLRRVFSQMGRRDLADKVQNGVDPDVFRPEFDF